MDNESTALTPDRDAFARVWQRVMPEGGPLVLAEKEDCPPPANLPKPLPLGEGSASAEPFLRERIACELKNAKSCHEICNCWGYSGRMMDLVARCQRRARRLAAALLLISGEWYLPVYQVQPRGWPDLRGGLRGLFHTFQREEVLYRSTAQGQSDPLLQELLMELGEESLLLRDMVRMELEKR